MTVWGMRFAAATSRPVKYFSFFSARPIEAQNALCKTVAQQFESFSLSAAYLAQRLDFLEGNSSPPPERLRSASDKASLRCIRSVDEYEDQSDRLKRVPLTETVAVQMRCQAFCANQLGRQLRGIHL